MKRVVLNFIFKDEEHVIERMLNSNLHFADLIVCVDTGSTDNTVDVIKKWAEINKKQLFIFYRTFDYFDNSRNFALNKLKEVVSTLGWDETRTYGYWLDCDEVVTDNGFDKNTLTEDSYLCKVHLNGDIFSRLTFFRLDLPFFWYGPVHEYLKCDSKFTCAVIENFEINVYNDGNSWQNNLTEKYLNHANILEKHLQKNDITDAARWLFYLAQSYYFSALFTFNNDDRICKLNKALKVYRERVAMTADGYSEEIFYSQYIIGRISYLLEKDWDVVLNEYTKADDIDPIRAETTYKIICHYYDNDNYTSAYEYSKKSLKLYHGKNPFPQRLLFVELELYNWKLLYKHLKICVKINHIDEAKITVEELNNLVDESPEWFNSEDLNDIREVNQFLTHF
ncbi:glycosyltransferase [Chryseobacterium sp. Marseille-Q8038]